MQTPDSRSSTRRDADASGILAFVAGVLISSPVLAQTSSAAPPPRVMRDAMIQPMGDGPTIRTTWNRPQFLTADSTHICAIDYADVDVSCLAWPDKTVRRLGGVGQGPGEYEDARTVQLVRNSFLLHDAQLRRATLFARNGTYRKQWPILQALSALFMDDRGDLWGVPSFGEELLWRLGSDGTVQERIPRPASLHAADLFAMQFSVQRLDSTTTLLASRTNGRLYLFDLKARKITDIAGKVSASPKPAVAAKIKLPDGTTADGFRPAPGMRYTNLSVALANGHLLTVAGTAEPAPRRLVDVYDARTLVYRCSFTLPTEIWGMAMDPEGHLLVLSWEPEPRIARYGLSWDRCK